ncbi:MAG: HAD family hydrolase [Tannerella sp.]|jgi:putative hydrolase of the HAD superfamily|nr:HAD family hydrolase [Tannerella sp.]
MIQHISFDLWLTLIKSNPLFKRKRAELIADRFRPKNMTVEQIEMLIRQEDNIFDRYNEMQDNKIPAKYMYLHILRKMDLKCGDITEDDAEWVMQQSNELLMDYTPRLLNEHVPDILAGLQSEVESMNIGSNTGFIEGKALRKVLKKTGIHHFFTFFVFSDEVRVSKPSARFFQHIHEGANMPGSSILHIGDNPKTDYRGAADFGFNALLITHPNYTLNDIRAKL